MIISEKGDEVLIPLKDYAEIMYSLGQSYTVNTYREHIKNGKLKNGIYENGMYAVWVKSAVYNAIFNYENNCKKCMEYESKLKAISSIAIG